MVRYEPVQAICMRVTGRRVAPSTLWRWIRRGNRGGKLQAVHIHGTWHTTPEAFADFIERSTAAALTPRDEAPSATDDDLRAAGLL